MPKTCFNFEDSDPKPGKDVKQTNQLEARTGNSPYDTGDNKLERYTSQHGNLGMLGDRNTKATSGK